jgi:hypothetical protein
VPASNSRGLYRGIAAPALPHPVAHRAPPKIVAPPPVIPTGVSVEVYQGDKKAEVVKCTDDGCGAK